MKLLCGVAIFLTLLLVCLNLDLICSPVRAQATPPTVSSCKLQMSMDWNAGSYYYDSSGNGNHGTEYGDTHLDTDVGDKKGKKMIHLDGAGDYIQVSDTTNLRPSTFTLSAWVCPLTTPDNDDNIISKKYGDSPRYYSYGLKIMADFKIVLVISDSTTERSLLSSNALVEDCWYHIVGTYDGSELHIYINGASSGSSSVSGTIPYTNTPVNIGRYSSSYPNADFNGYIDDVGIYNTAMSSGQINDLYYYSQTHFFITFDSISGNDALDNSFYHNEVAKAGDASFTASGPTDHGNALYLDGTGDYAYTDPASEQYYFVNKQYFTIGAWVKVGTVDVHDNIMSNKYGVGARYYCWGLKMQSDGRVTFVADIDSAERTVTTVTDIDDGVYHHVAATWDGRYMRIYLNGGIEATTDMGAGSHTIGYNTNEPIYLGCYNGNQVYLNGYIDDAFFSPIVLTEQQIDELRDFD